MKRDDGTGHGSVVKHWLTTEIHAVRKRTIKESLTVQAADTATTEDSSVVQTIFVAPRKWLPLATQ